MTAQFPERLRYEGQEHAMYSDPLAPYLRALTEPPKFGVRCTANWRGYVGSWEITENRLYLVSLQGKLADGRPATLQSLFPEASQQIFAGWYTGTLRIPQGELLRYAHAGFASVYKEDLLLDVRDGVVVSTSVRSNDVQPHGHEIEGEPRSLMGRLMTRLREGY